MNIQGFHFFIVGLGFGKFNPATDPANFNLDVVSVKNTIGTPPGGWVAICFVPDNPGIMLYYCQTVFSQFVLDINFML